jgi:hypothetical protein
MSFSSRHSPRFSYSTGRSACPTELLGQSTFWLKNNINDDDSRRRRSPLPQTEIPDYYPYQQQQVVMRGMMNEDERKLLTFLGIGIITAILIDAVAHRSS